MNSIEYYSCIANKFYLVFFITRHIRCKENNKFIITTIVDLLLMDNIISIVRNVLMLMIGSVSYDADINLERFNESPIM